METNEADLTVEAPELGSALAAVEGFVSLLSTYLKKDERKIHYWLDTYFQLRLAYEIELRSADEEEDTISTKPVETETDAQFKKRTLQDLQVLRAYKVSAPTISKLANGKITSDEIMSILEGEKLSIEKWKALRRGIDKYYAQKGN